MEHGLMKKTDCYAPYTGVDYTVLTSDKNRIAALDKARDMATVRWIAPCDLVTWCSSKGIYSETVSEDGAKDTKYLKGKVYVGVAYTKKDHTYDDKKWLEKLSDLTSERAEKQYYKKHKKTGTAIGINCSYFVYVCLKNTGLDYRLTYQKTKIMMDSADYILLENYGDLRPADLLLTNGHVRLFAGKTADGKYAVFEATSKGSKCRYYEYGYDELEGYLPYRFKGFI